jgi:hypothetical protein
MVLAVTVNAAPTLTFAAALRAAPMENSVTRRRPAATAPVNPKTINIAASPAKRA